jgi:hypothetical protein
VRRARLLVLAVPWQLTQTYSGTCNGRPTRLLKLEGIEVRDDADLWLSLCGGRSDILQPFELSCVG